MRRRRMNQLYIGNLSPAATAQDLRQLFGERQLPLPGQVLLKSGYAFVDYPDQNWAIRAIETLSGKVELHGKVMEVDYSVPKKLRQELNVTVPESCPVHPFTSHEFEVSLSAAIPMSWAPLGRKAPGTSPRVSGNAHREQKIEFGVLKVGLLSVLVLYPKTDIF
ncbi:hypothetical protein Nmel_011573 [Mimus melanotis]